MNAISIALRIGWPTIVMLQWKTPARKPPTSAPTTPAITSPRSPRPWPRAKWLAKNPATKPTRIQSRTVSKSRLRTIYIRPPSPLKRGDGPLRGALYRDVKVGRTDEAIRPGTRQLKRADLPAHLTPNLNPRCRYRLKLSKDFPSQAAADRAEFVASSLNARPPGALSAGRAAPQATPTASGT